VLFALVMQKLPVAALCIPVPDLAKLVRIHAEGKAHGTLVIGQEFGIAQRPGRDQGFLAIAHVDPEDLGMRAERSGGMARPVPAVARDQRMQRIVAQWCDQVAAGHVGRLFLDQGCSVRFGRGGSGTKSEQQCRAGAIGFHREQLTARNRPVDATKMQAFRVHDAIRRKPPVAGNVVTFARSQHMRLHVHRLDQLEHDLAAEHSGRRNVVAVR